MYEAKAAGATMVEVRLDHMYGWLLAAPRSGEPKIKEDLKKLLENRPVPVILTYRPKWEGGQYEGDELDRLRVIWDAMDLEVDYVDIELGGIQKDIEKEAYKYVYDSYYPDLKLPKVRQMDMTHKYDVEFEVSRNTTAHSHLQCNVLHLIVSLCGAERRFGALQVFEVEEFAGTHREQMA